MSDDITIPPEAMEAALEAFAHASGLGIFPDDEHDEEWRDDLQNGMRAAIRAALMAWTGMHTGWQCTGCGEDAQIILPLPPKENSDEN